MNRFRTAAIAMIVFNIVGTVLTWTLHLQKPGTSNAHAIAQGTEFSGPVILIALWCVFVAMTYQQGRRVTTIGAALMTLFGLIFSVGEISELAKNNVGVSSTKWNFIIAATVVGLVIGLSTFGTGVVALLARRRQHAAAA